MIVTLTHKLAVDQPASEPLVLALTAEERTRSRQRIEMPTGQVILLQLPRGTPLREGDLLAADTADLLVRIQAKPEPVYTVRSETALALLQAAYHLGNRHVPLEIMPTYLRLTPDPVLRDLLHHRGLTIVEEIQPFQPEIGAYAH